MPDADFGIWHKEAIPRFMKGWCDAIREVDREHILIADNIHSQVAPGAMYDRPHGDFEIKTAVDEIGMSFYPKQQTSYMSPATRWEVFDSYACAARREGFFISEMQTHIQALFNPGTCVLPEELKLWCHEAYAAGAKGLIYWMWRPFTKGLQTLGRGIVNYRTVPTERYGLVKEMSEELFGKYGVITPVRSKVGVLYHELSDDLSRKYACYNTVDSDIYLRSVFGAYKAFMDSGVRADIITLDELSGYECVVITNACAMSRADCDRIAEFVKGGGRVILDGKVAIVDEASLQYEYIPGGGLHERQQRQELVVYRIVALAEGAPLLARGEEAPALLRAIAKLREAVRELYSVEVQLPPLRDIAPEEREGGGLLRIVHEEDEPLRKPRLDLRGHVEIKAVLIPALPRIPPRERPVRVAHRYALGRAAPRDFRAHQRLRVLGYVEIRRS